MRKSHSNPVPRRRSWFTKAFPALCAFATTLLALPVNAAITLPNDPLTTDTRVAPNILFVLDDSGSMAFDAMPSNSIGSGWSNRSYINNSVYYDPRRTYTPWLNADGSQMTGGTSYDAVYGDFNLASGGTIDLGNGSSCRRYNRNDDATSGVMSGNNGTQVCGGTQTFYVPIDLTATTANQNQVYRYQIHTDGRIVRSQLGTRTRGENNRDCGNGNNDWGSCTYATPTGRSEAAEKANYATWFSYHRTRMKAAKAGAGEAFTKVGVNVRVGFRTIWGRNGSSTNDNWPTQNVPIPVNNNSGLFDNPNGPDGANNNRTRWYQRLYGAIGYSGTPLHDALHNAGVYFSSNASNGPYGPEAAVNQFSCRQNFSILTTDGYWNNTSSGSNPGEQDNANGSVITGTGGRTYEYTASAPYASSHSNTLADVAMRYWKNDLRTDLDNNVPTTGINPAFWQHMVTFGISIGLAGNTGYGSVAAVPANFSAWPNPTDAEDADRIDDLLHAAVNGRGEFVSAADPVAFSNGLTAALAAITERTGSFSNVSANSTSVDGGTRVYQASYISGVWTGELVAFPVVDNAVRSVPSWRASAGIPATGRKLFTSNDAGNAAVAFPGGLSSARLTQLTRTGAINYPVTGADNAAYLAGTRSLELSNGGTLRNRNHLLGDIITSSPAYVKQTDTLYVGANDGMLHAFDAANGQELFAYVPGGINWSALGSLSRPDYSHRYFVDGPIVVSTRSQAAGRNVLVGGLGKGGKGLFALDVTNPGSFAAGDFKWEVRDTNGNMGWVQSRPIITTLNDGQNAVIVANGLNSTNGRAVLLIYNLDTGALIKELDTGIGSAVTDHADSNGLSTPVGWDADGNGTIDYVYAGDLLGNVWKFDLRAGASASWNIANSSAPIFQAVNAAGVRQPVVGGISIAMHPQTYRTWVFFGTGRLMTAGDMTNKSVQSLYGFVDDGSTIARSGADANLTRRTTVVSGTISTYPVRSFEAKTALPTASKGWYIDLLTPPAPGTAEGERIISDAQLYGDALLVSSVIPTAEACRPDGRGYINALDAFTGTSTGPSLFDLDGDGQFDDETLDNGGNPLPIGSVDLGVGMPTLAEVMKGLAAVGGSSGSVGSLPVRENRNVGRVSWREVINN